jgi:hypothetical protein
MIAGLNETVLLRLYNDYNFIYTYFIEGGGGGVQENLFGSKYLYY